MMNLKIVAASVASAAALAAAGTPGLATANSGDPHANGCPSGWDALSVTDLTNAGYKVPASVDAAGNNDGIVCGLAWTAAEQAARLPNASLQIYEFRDNDLPPFAQS
jgi:hypothetical protein